MNNALAMESGQGNWLLMVTVNSFTKRPEAYSTPHENALSMAEASVTKFSCCFRVLWELHSDHGCNFESGFGFAVPKGKQDTYHTPALRV
jgi:hypothetical protein